MTTKFFLPLLVASGLFLTSPDALAQNNAFTYQGRLNAGGVPANGNYDLRFALFAASAGGTQFVTAIDDSGAQTAGVRILAGETAWSAISDKNSKKNFQPLDSLATLEKLAAIPVQKWNYKWESETNTPHIGPVAQDFKEAFYPGRDDKTISTLEFDGVELAAIQGLNLKLAQEAKEREARIRTLEEDLRKLKEIVNQIRKEPK